MSETQTPRQRTWLKVLAIIVVFVLLCVIFHRPILFFIGDYLVVSEPVVQADVIRVLGGAPERYIYGANLYNQGYGSKLVMSMSTEFKPLLQRTNDQIVTEYAMSNGIPEEDVSVFAAESTYEEAKLTEQLLDQKQVQSLLIVSSPFHMRRVSMTFKRVIRDKARLIFVAVPFSESEYQRMWWTDEDSIRFVITEYIVIVYYAFKYFWSF